MEPLPTNPESSVKGPCAFAFPGDSARGVRTSTRVDDWHLLGRIRGRRCQVGVVSVIRTVADFWGVQKGRSDASLYTLIR